MKITKEINLVKDKIFGSLCQCDMIPFNAFNSAGISITYSIGWFLPSLAAIHQFYFPCYSYHYPQLLS